MLINTALANRIIAPKKCLWVAVVVSVLSLIRLTNLFVIVGRTFMVDQPKIDLPEGYGVYTPFCKIRDLEPNSAEIKHVIKYIGEWNCTGMSPLEVKVGTMLKLDRHQVLQTERKYKGRLSCVYDRIDRATGDSAKVTPLNKAVTFHFQNVPHDFIIMTCSIKGKGIIYQTTIPFVQNKKPLGADKVKCRPNVIIMMIDSVSRNNMKRKLQQTYRILTEEYDAFDFKGHNKVADNTFVNVVPMLTGKFLGEVWNESMAKIYLDYIPLIWKRYQKKGYLTLYQEDTPGMSTFNYLKKGFMNPPTDYYMRPFFIASSRMAPFMINQSDQYCHNSKAEVEVMLSYVLDFLNHKKEYPKFVFSVTNSFSHDDINTVGYLDRFYSNFFRRLRYSPSFNNTVVFLLSDHGLRFGEIRETYTGKLEERLPMLLIALPPRFKVSYPQIWENIQSNTRSLTTHFDTYWTLEDILNYPEFGSLQYSPNAKGKSLLSRVSVNRTCQSEHVSPHWCVCEESTKVSSQDPTVIKCAQFIIDHINFQLSSLELCQKWTLGKVMSSYKTAVNHKFSTFKSSENDVINLTVLYGPMTKGLADYLITVRAAPNGAIFEATVRWHASLKEMSLVGDISRINKYSSQDYCIRHQLLQSGQQHLGKFCHCLK